ncbi:hypothetical protein ACSQ67_023205 [Phaseolus vulgaris]
MKFEMGGQGRGRNSRDSADHQAGRCRTCSCSEQYRKTLWKGHLVASWWCCRTDSRESAVMVSVLVLEHASLVLMDACGILKCLANANLSKRNLVSTWEVVQIAMAREEGNRCMAALRQRMWPILQVLASCSTILLDDQMEPKLAGFGVSMQGSRFMSKQKQINVDRVLECLENPVKEGIDPIIKGKIAPDCWQVFVDVMVTCLKYDPDERPTIGEVEVQLEHAGTS